MKRVYTEYTHPTLPTQRILNIKGVTLTRDKKLRDLGYTRTMRIEINKEFCDLGYTRTMRIEINKEFCDFLKKTIDK